MKIVELLRPKVFKDNSLLSKEDALRELSLISKRINHYSDKLNSKDLKSKERSFYKKNLEKDLKAVKELTEKLTESIMVESVHKIPMSDSELEELKHRLDGPIPAEIATIILDDILMSDELTDEYQQVAQRNPNQDVRPIVIKWLELNMPSQISKFTRCF